MTEYIYYTGIGSKRKDGKHSIDEFLKIANKNFKMDCSKYLPEIEYEHCIKKNKILDNDRKYRMRNNISVLKYKRSKRRTKKLNQLKDKCEKYKKTAKRRKCNTHEYIKYSGAEKRTVSFKRNKTKRGGKQYNTPNGSTSNKVVIEKDTTEKKNGLGDVQDKKTADNIPGMSKEYYQMQALINNQDAQKQRVVDRNKRRNDEHQALRKRMFERKAEQALQNQSNTESQLTTKKRPWYSPFSRK